MRFPEIGLITQRLHAQEVADIPRAVQRELSALQLQVPAERGESVAVAVGSRGISHISLILKECIGFLKERRLIPFIVPAMGSHGGNTARGEKAVLASLGITESSMGAPIHAGGDLVELGKLDVGIPILMDRHSAEADHIVIINRVKPHTKFHAPIESGLTKMLAIGLGKARGAALYHRAAVQHTFSILPHAASQILEKRSILFGLAILEDGYRNVARVSAVRPGDWFEEERSLLEEARSLMPRIPFDEIDILVIDEIGKEISGIGMDSNVTGRHRDIVGDFFTAPHVKRIFVRDLSAGTGGNANGIGLADVTTQRLVDAVDLDKTYTNALAAISPEKAAIPMHFRTDRQCLGACLNTIGMVEPEAARIVRIKNTLKLDRFFASRALEPEILSNPGLHMQGPWTLIGFDDRGNFQDLL